MKVVPTSRASLKGFTIMETLLAIGIIAMLLGIFLTLFLPAKDMIRDAIAREESERISSVLRSEMLAMRENEIANSSATKSTASKYISGFDKGFNWIKRSTRPGTSIVIFSYRADLNKAPRKDGTYPAVQSGKNTPVGSTSLISMACPMDEALHREDIMNAVGHVFVVKMTQLVEQEDGSFKLAPKPGLIEKASTPEAYVSSSKEKLAWGGVLFFQADFYIMNPKDPARYKNMSWAKMPRPIFTTNMTIRR